MASRNSKRRAGLLGVALAAAAAAMIGIPAQQARAVFQPVTIYATVENSPTGANGLYAVKVYGTNNVLGDTTSGFTTTLITSATFDSLAFDSSGNIILTGGGSNGGAVTKLSGFNPATNTYATSTVWANLGINGSTAIQDVAIEPTAVSATIPGYVAGHNYALISDMGTGLIGRIDTTTGTVSWLGSPAINYGNYNNGVGQPGPEGLVYVPDKASATGYDLIATIGNRNTVGARTLAQLNPITGAVSSTNLKTGLSYNDGLGYDPSNGLLYSSNRGTPGLYVGINPLNLAAFSGTQVAIPSDGTGTTLSPDGVAPDGFGNVYVAGFDYSPGPGNIYMYDETLGTMTAVAHLAGLDDISPLAGTGSLPTPEPASLALLGLGLGGLMLRRRNRR